MSKRIKNAYHPDMVSPPGETLAELLGFRGMTQAELSQRMGRPTKTINEIIQGKTALTPETAVQLETVLGVPARIWNKRELAYRESLVEQAVAEGLQAEIAVLDEFPVAALERRRWMPTYEEPVRRLRELLRFFGVAGVVQLCQWRDKALAAANFRQSTSFHSDPGTVAAWMRKGEEEASRIKCAPYDEQAFQAALHSIRALTQETPEVFQPEIVKRCAAVGVAVAFVQEFPAMAISGVTCWLTPHKALIQVSLRYKNDDQLWFSFFHEAAHILKHGKRDVFVEGEGINKSNKEKEADDWAAEFLIPSVKYRQFVQTTASRSKQGIQTFADQIGIAPGIIVGRLQHDKYLPFTHCNELKQKIVWSDD